MNLKINWFIRVKHYDKDWNLVSDTWFIKNTITNTGKAELANLAGNVSTPTAFTYIAIGTSNTAPAATQTALVAETSATWLARAAATVTRSTTTVTNDTLQLDKTFTNNSAGSVTIEEQGVFNAASVWIMLGRGLTTTKAVGVWESLAVTHKFVFA